MTPTPDHDPHQVASAALTRLTLDLRAAVVHAHDADSRNYAFALAHLVRELSEILAGAIWTSPQHAGEAALAQLSRRARTRPSEVPDWLRVLAAGWPST